MSYEVTATKKRPQDFDSMVGQDFVVSTLKNSIKQGRIAHAYLFSGPRGVGKTSAARLLAKALNCEKGPTDNPCGECNNCKAITKGNSLDVIEIDGASNTGVSDVRVIKEEVLFPPSSSAYKIYIIDEVHMLSQSAFNALLKTIEEPPEYVVFIFATTELQKVPATIRSRCQQFNFHLISSEIITSQLEKAANDLNIKFEKSALNWIAKEATGSMRDAYTLFDQVVSFSEGNITMTGIRDKLGLTGQDRLNSMVLNLLDNNVASAILEFKDLLSYGESIEQIIKDFTEYFRTLLLMSQGIKSESVLGLSPDSFPVRIKTAYSLEQLEAALELLFDMYRNIKYSIDPVYEFEFILSRLSHLKYLSSNTEVISKLEALKLDIDKLPVQAEEESTEPTKPNEKKKSEEVKEPELHKEVKTHKIVSVNAETSSNTNVSTSVKPSENAKAEESVKPEIVTPENAKTTEPKMSKKEDIKEKKERNNVVDIAKDLFSGVEVNI